MSTRISAGEREEGQRPRCTKSYIAGRGVLAMWSISLGAAVLDFSLH